MTAASNLVREFFALELVSGQPSANSILGMSVGLVAQDAGGQGGGLINNLLTNPLILPVGLLFIFYVTFIGPERRRKAEEARMMAALKKNDRVVTVGGIHGTIVSAAADSDIVTVRIDENSNTRVRVNRSAIARITESTKPPKDKEPDPETKE